MRFRKIREYLNSNDWRAIGIDLLIVVVGVFMGLQLENWNAEREADRDFAQAKQKLIKETKANLQTLETLSLEVKSYLEAVTKGFDALIQCQDSAADLENINTAINAITGTYGVNLRTDALEKILAFNQLQKRTYAELGTVISDTKWIVDLSLKEANIIEVLPLELSTEATDSVEVSTTIEERQITYSGVNYSRRVRELRLAVPVSKACQDQQLLKRFYTWERWQGFMPRLIENIRVQYRELESALDDQSEPS